MTNRPSLAYRSHFADVEPPAVDERAFRQGWRIVTRLDGLLAGGLIAPGTWQAAVEYRSACELAHRTTGLGSMLRDGYGAGSGRAGALDRAARVLAVETTIGRLDTALCRACLIADAPWTTIGRLAGVGDVTAKTWTIRALVALAWAWRGWDGAPGTGQHTGATARAAGGPSRAPREGGR